MQMTSLQKFARRRDLDWPGAVLIFLSGIGLIVADYGIYQDDAWQDYMSTNSPVVCMRIVEHVRGAGTLKLPDVIYADYYGKTYDFEMGRKYFRSLAGVDSIAVCLDIATGRAFLPMSGRVGHNAFLYAMIAGCSLMFIGGGISEFLRLRKKARQKLQA